MNKPIIILTGEKQTGKTTTLKKICEIRKDIAGILSPVENSKRVFFDITSQQYFEMECNNDKDNRLSIGKYFFSSEGFKSASNLLIEASLSNKTNYLIIDEIGPLEMIQNAGFYAAFEKIVSSKFNYQLIIVVRPSLIIAVKEFLEKPKNLVRILNINQFEAMFK